MQACRSLSARRSANNSASCCAQIRDEGVPFFVHQAPGGPVEGEWFEQIKSDVNDFRFLERFQNGLKSSNTFRGQQIARGNYGEFGDENNIAQKMMAVDLSADLKTHGSPMELFEDPGIRHFDLSTVSADLRRPRKRRFWRRSAVGWALFLVPTHTSAMTPWA